jgi:putative ABC transport system permease protein
MRRVRYMENFAQDVRYGLRMLAKSPSFTLAAVVALAFGIGANSCIFSMVNSVLLHALPYPGSDRIVAITQSDLRRNLRNAPLSYPKFLGIAEQNQVFADVGVYAYQTFNLTGGGEPEQVAGVRVSEGFFPVLGVQPMAGRWFEAAEDRRGGSDVVVLSHRLWQQRFNSDSALVGRNVELNARSTTVVGIMPADFHFPDSTIDVWMPRAFESALLTREQMDRGAGFLGLIARLKPEDSLTQAKSQIDTINHRYGQEDPANLDASWQLAAVPLLDATVNNIRTTLWVLLGAVGCVLLIACANVSNLLLVRGTTRQREVSIRLALGAPRARLVRQFLTENLVLWLAGGALGVGMASWGLSRLPATASLAIPRAGEIRLDVRALLYTLLLTIVTGVLFGLAPAWRASAASLLQRLNEGARSGSASLRRNRLRSSLVIGEIALALLLLAGAGLLLRSFVRLMSVHTGFAPHGLLTLRIALPPDRYPQPKRQAEFFSDVLRKVRTLPGVQAASVISYLPLAGGGIQYFFHAEGQLDLSASKSPFAPFLAIDPEYFHTMGIPLLRGRAFTDQDHDTTLKVAIINQSIAKRFWPGEDPIGKHLTYSREHITVQIVGMVGDVKRSSLDSDGEDQVYLPFAQRPWPTMTLVARSSIDPWTLAQPIRSQILEVDKDQPVSYVRTMEQVIAESVAKLRLTMSILAIFAAVAAGLAAVGIYGVMSYAVSQRAHELGVRMALGAGRADLLRLVALQGITLTLVGMGLGLLGAFGLTRYLSSLLFAVRPLDFATFAAATAGLFAVAMCASLVPAYRATKADPMVALRYE